MAWRSASGSAVEVKSCSSIAETSLRPSLWPASLRPVSLMSGQDAASLHMSQDALSRPVTVGGAVGDALPRLLPGVFLSVPMSSRAEVRSRSTCSTMPSTRPQPSAEAYLP